MKKIFVEPSMKKIELNLSENIADSSQAVMGYYFKVDLFDCTIQNTGKYYGEYTREEAATCKINVKAKIGGGVVIPEEIVNMHIRR